MANDKTEDPDKRCLCCGCPLPIDVILAGDIYCDEYCEAGNERTSDYDLCRSEDT